VVEPPPNVSRAARPMLAQEAYRQWQQQQQPIPG